MAHEVNTPLAVISSYAQMLCKQVRVTSKLATGEDHATDLPRSEIVNHLLNFSGTSSTEFTEVDLNKTIDDTLALLEHQLNTAGIKVKDELNRNLPLIHGNSWLAGQVFWDPFRNATTRWPVGTRPVATTNGDVVCVDVGHRIGIAHEHIDRIESPVLHHERNST